MKFDQVPVLSEALPLAQQGIGPGAIGRNLASYGHEVDFAPQLPEWQQRLLADPQTSGGLLVAVAPEAADEVLAHFPRSGIRSGGGDRKHGAGCAARGSGLNLVPRTGIEPVTSP